MGAPEYGLADFTPPGYPQPFDIDNIGAVSVYSLDFKTNTAALAYGPYFTSFWDVDSYTGTSVAVSGDGKFFSGSATYDGYSGLAFAYKLQKSYASNNVFSIGGVLQPPAQPK